MVSKHNKFFWVLVPLVAYGTIKFTKNWKNYLKNSELVQSQVRAIFKRLRKERCR
jgi:hypothetical protein